MVNIDAFNFTERMYRSTDLRRRWPSLLIKELAQGIDDSINAANPAFANKPESMTDFPKPYWHMATRYSLEGKAITSCVPCEELFLILKNGEYKRPYKVTEVEGRKRNKYSFKRILFRKTDILAYEDRHTDAEGYFVFGEPEEKFEVVVPQELFVGKSPRGVISAMRAPEKNFAEEVIAYVLYNWRGQTNVLQLGTLLKIDGGITPSACDKYARKLLRQAEEMKIVYE